MHEQLTPAAPARARRFARRFTLAASVSFAVCAVAAAPAFALNAPQRAPQATPTQEAAPPKAAKATAAAEKGAPVEKARTVEKAAAPKAQPASTPAVSSSEIKRARRAAPVAVPAAPSVSPAAASPSATPAAAPATAPALAAPVVDAPAATKAVAAPESDAKKSPESVDAELEALRTEIKDAKSGAERARLQRALVDKLVALEREPEALDALRLMIHEDRYDPPFFFNTGNALARLGDASAAEDAYRKAIQQRRGHYARALNNLGVILIRQGNWEEARATLASALRQENNTYAEASYNLGRLYLLRGEADLAIREWLRTISLDPEHAEAAVALARTYAEDGSMKRGLAVLDNFVARATRTGASVPREIADARRELFEATTSGADDAPVSNVKTSARDEATTATSRTMANDGVGNFPDSTRTGRTNFRPREVDRATYDLLQEARTSRENGSYEESVKHYRGVLARSPGGYFPPANLELGAALINLQRDTEAIAVLAPLAERDSARYPVAYYHLGRLYERQGELERAAQSFARAAELYGDTNPQVLLDLSRTREKSGDAAGALAAMNAYAGSIARQGSVPAWVAERQAKLRQKAAAPAPKQ